MIEQTNYNTSSIILPNTPEHLNVLESDITNQEHINALWLEDAMPIEIYLSKSKHLRKLIKAVYLEVEQIIKIPNRHRYYEVIKFVLINLWNAHLIGKPLMYSRNRNHYTQDSRYGKLFIKYDRLIPVIDTLEKLEYINQKYGFWNHENKFGRSSRIWLTDKLSKLFVEYNLNNQHFYNLAKPEKFITLRDGTKLNKQIKFQMTPTIKLLNEDIQKYNSFIDQHHITLNIKSSVLITTEFLTRVLYPGILNNSIQVKSIHNSNLIESFNKNSTINKQVIQLFSNNKQYRYNIMKGNIQPYHSLCPMTKSFFSESLLCLGSDQIDPSLEMLKNFLADLSFSISKNPDKERRKQILAEEYPLNNIGIDLLVLRIFDEYIHRVFNRKSFKLGGRGYGALHQRIPKNLRRCIEINGEPTVELDYSAYHIRMLYHQKNIEYLQDPYTECEGPDMRDIYKIVGLVGINAKNVHKAKGGIKNKFEEEGIPVPDDEVILKLINRFRDAHPEIADYIYNDMGIRLMNIDSRIMNTILMKLMDKGILGLSVYDSIIVAEQHRDYLYQLMTEVYEKEMGFKPKIG